MPAINVFVCEAPMRMASDSAATPKLPMSMLLLPIVRLTPASLPNAMLKLQDAARHLAGNFSVGAPPSRASPSRLAHHYRRVISVVAAVPVRLGLPAAFSSSQGTRLSPQCLNGKFYWI